MIGAKEGKEDGRWLLHEVRGKSELHRAGCLVKAREAGASPSTVQIGIPASVGMRATATNAARPRSSGVKRAILPAAISESAGKDGGSPRLEVESSHGGDDVTGAARRCRER